MDNLENYKLVFEEDFELPELNVEKWEDKQPWGRIHPNNPHQYYHPDCVQVRDENLILKQKYFHTEVDHWNGEKYIPEYAVGLVASKQSWKYGLFEFEAKLPTGKGLWPALWLTAREGWPPEIDIVEGYTTDKTHYNIFPWFFKRRVETNIHYRETADHSPVNIKGKPHWMWKDPAKHFIKYSCHWTKNFINLYYDKYLVRSITDPYIMAGFNKEMYIVLNNAIHKDYMYSINPYQESELEIKSVKVYQNEEKSN